MKGDLAKEWYEEEFLSDVTALARGPRSGGQERRDGEREGPLGEGGGCGEGCGIRRHRTGEG